MGCIHSIIIFLTESGICIEESINKLDISNDISK